MNNLARVALGEYQSTDNSAIAYADPHELIMRLIKGAIERVQQAKHAISQGDTARKGELIGKAMGIIGGLDACLDRSLDNQIINNLEALYEYMNLCSHAHIINCHFSIVTSCQQIADPANILIILTVWSVNLIDG